MDRNEIVGKWKQIKGAVKRKWGKLTDDDLMVGEGDLDRLAGKIQERYGVAKDKATAELDVFLDELLRKETPEKKRPGERAA